MVLTVIVLTVLLCLLFYFIMNDKINRIKKEYVKNDIINDIQDIITVFNDEAHRNITVLEELSKDLDSKIKKAQKVKKDLERVNLPEISNETPFSDTKSDELQDKKEIVLLHHDYKQNEISAIEDWEEKAYKMYENGFSIHEIMQKINKNEAETSFAISFMKLNKKKELFR